MGMPRQSVACAPDLRSSPPRSVWRLPLMWEKPRNLEAPPSTKVGVTQLKDWWCSPFPAKITARLRSAGFGFILCMHLNQVTCLKNRRPDLIQKPTPI